jgi:hypothetical protein
LTAATSRSTVSGLLLSLKRLTSPSERIQSKCGIA